jgi:hypothetical protein
MLCPLQGMRLLSSWAAVKKTSLAALLKLIKNALSA